MISSKQYQMSRQLRGVSDYDQVFISRIFKLIKLGYDRLDSKKYASDQETATTGDLVEAIEQILDAAPSRWMRFFSVFDDPPVNESMRQRRRRGRKRNRVDIRFDYSELSPRLRFRFECKRLGAGHGVGRYLGDDGLGCFISGKYAYEDTRGGMLGYVQSDDEQTWADRIGESVTALAVQYAVRDDGQWRHAPVIRELFYSYRSGHSRGRGRPPIEIFHTLLMFR